MLSRSNVREIPTPKNKSEAEQAANNIASLIRKIAEKDEDTGGVNQVELNLAFRSYFQVLCRYELDDTHFGYVRLLQFAPANGCSYQLLYGMLLTEHSGAWEPNRLRTQLVQALSCAVQRNENFLLPIVKTLNLLCKKFPDFYLELTLPLEDIYYCLQSGQYGLRDETLLLFTQCCKHPRRAHDYFNYILEFWPWTNRNKLYLLSCCLCCHKLQDLLQSPVNEFLEGLRLCLNYKKLLAASQYLVRVLSNQESRELLELSVVVLTRGSRSEVQNLHAHWFSRIAQKADLFTLLQQQPEIACFLEDSSSANDPIESFRLILIFSMFSRQIFATSKLHFFKISTELITNCFQYEVESQMLIFRFVIDNMTNFAIEDCLEFVLAFIRHHKSVENAQYRNNILGKLPMVINYISKTFSKLHVDANTTLAASISTFFQHLQMLAETDMQSDLYQPKIFALKLCEILLKSLYSQTVTKNAKSCSVEQNKLLGDFLVRERRVFDAAHISNQLLGLLSNPLGFDDAHELVVQLLGELSHIDSTLRECAKLCLEFCKRVDVDECILSHLYASVALRCSASQTLEERALSLYEDALNSLNTALLSFRKDPLLTCKTQCHIFGYLNALNEVVNSVPWLCASSYPELLLLLKEIVKIILDFLSLTKSDTDAKAVASIATNAGRTKAAASFQDMEESLELLVLNSSFEVIDPVECRKGLLMSFWLTLKACCDVATGIGSVLASKGIETDPQHLDVLARCLEVNVAVLTCCRHKGAIEAAGLSVGRLTKSITSYMEPTGQGYKLLHNCLQLLFDSAQQISTTRRGAGYSIMLLHIVKNEQQRPGRSILQRVMSNIWQHLQSGQSTIVPHEANSNCDRIEALTLHYLCVLVNDTELRDAMLPHYDEIMMAAITQIDNIEWTVCNAALQLFGALVPKIVGQRQATEVNTFMAWESTEVTYGEIARKLPKVCSYILQYCSTDACLLEAKSKRSIILFLSFLAKVEHLRKGDSDEDMELLRRFRELLWRLLNHPCEKVRRLSATCMVRAHDIRCDLTQALLAISKIIYTVQNPNFFEGLVFALTDGVAKVQHEGQYTLPLGTMAAFKRELRHNLSSDPQLRADLKPYALSKFLELLLQVGFDGQSLLVRKLAAISVSVPDNSVGRDVLMQTVNTISN